jgi:hypothetical protein
MERRPFREGNSGDALGNYVGSNERFLTGHAMARVKCPDSGRRKSLIAEGRQQVLGFLRL